MAFVTYSALYLEYLNEQQRPSKRWLRIRQIFYILIMVGIAAWITWMGFTEPGTMWHFTILTTLRSDPNPYPGIGFAPQHLLPLKVLGCTVFPTLIGADLVLYRMSKKGWTLGGMCLLYVLIVSSTVAALAVHVYL